MHVYICRNGTLVPSMWHACMPRLTLMPHRITPNQTAFRTAIKTHAGGSRDELARLVSVDRATAYRIEAGKVDPSPKFIAGLMSLTGLKFEDLFEITTDAA